MHLYKIFCIAAFLLTLVFVIGIIIAIDFYSYKRIKIDPLGESKTDKFYRDTLGNSGFIFLLTVMTIVLVVLSMACAYFLMNGVPKLIFTKPY